MTEDLTAEEIDFLNSIFDLARDNKPQALSSLIEQGIPVNLTNAKGDTLLILAAYHLNAEVVAALIAAGADLDRVNDRGQSALACAVFRGNQQIALQLLDAGADVHAGHQTPLEIARFFGIDHLVPLLEEHGTAPRE